MLRARMRGPGGEAKKLGTLNRTYIMAIYLALIAVFMFWYGGFVGMDVVLVILLLGVVILGRTRAFLRDWTPFIAILFVWQLLRGYADNAAQGLGLPLHSEDIIAAERWLFRGHIPSAVLQQAMYVPGQIHWYDIAATAIWAFHFVLPILFAFVLWMRDRQVFRRFINALMVLSFAGFATYVLFPAVPPWLAASPEFADLAEPITLIRVVVIEQMHFGTNLSVLLRTANPDPVAAMPSLHAAYPTLVFLFTLVYWRRLAPFAFLYCAWLWFSIIYIGDHYVVDALAGITYAGLSFLVTTRVMAALERRRQGTQRQQAAGAELPVLRGLP